MLQQTALILISGLIFLFSFTPDYEEYQRLSPLVTVLLILAFTFVPPLLCYLLGRILIRRFPDDYDRQLWQLRKLNYFASIFSILILCGFIFEIYYLRLPVMVNGIFSPLGFTNIRLLACMFPLVVSILLNKFVVFELERKIRFTFSVRSFLSLNLKLMFFPALPFIISLLISDIIDHSPLNIRIFFITHSYLYWAIMLIIITIAFIKAPFFLRRIWQSRPLPPGDIRRNIESLADREGIRYRDILVWNMQGSKIANAGVSGLTAKSRYIFVTDSLLENFSADEIETIVAHEFCHIKHKHIPSYLIFSFGYLIFYTFLYTRLFPVIEHIKLGNILSAFLGALVTIGAFLLYFVFIFRYLSRNFERQSDLCAISMTGKADSFKSALTKLAWINYIPHRISRLSEIFRTHPSIDNRLELVDRYIAGDREVLQYMHPVFGAARTTGLVAVLLIAILFIDKDYFFPPDEMHYEMGRQYAIEGMIDEAIDQFKEAVRYDPGRHDAFFALGLLYAQKGSIEDAIRELKTVLELDPQNKAARERLEQIMKKEE